jgi:RND family efflux transporter MFP subunit
VLRKSLVLLGFAAILPGLSGCGAKNEYAPPPPPAVTVANPVRRPVTDYVELTGSTQARAKVDLRARVNGYLRSINFEDGATVKEGELLFAIDEQPFQAALKAAQAKLAEAEATLKTARGSKRVEVARAALLVAQANALVSQLNEVRGRRLVERGAQAREEYDRQAADYKAAQAVVEARQADLQQAEVDFKSSIALAEASVENARAAVTTAELDVSYTKIVAPIGGRIGRRLVDVGNLVQSGTTLLATIESTDPVYVYFTLSESQVLYFTRLRQQNKLPALGTEPIPLYLGLGDEEDFPHEGRLDFAELGVDPDTGTTLRRGTFPNPDGTLVPGLFARVRGAVGQPTPRVLVPERAVGADQQGRYVLVVNDKDVVEYRPITPGIKFEGMRVVEKGLKGDEWVVVNGLLRARAGAKVDPQRGDALAFVASSAKQPTSAADRPAPKTEAGPPDPAANDDEQKPSPARDDRADQPDQPDASPRPK